MCVFVGECMFDRLKLAAWARSVGVHPQTAYAWVREDRRPVPFRRVPWGTVLVDVAAANDERVVRYARVCSHDQRSELDGQVSWLTEWATDAGMVVGQVVAGVGSGLTGKRPKLARILSDPFATVGFVEHRDRLARLGRSIYLRRWLRMVAGSWALMRARRSMIWWVT
jgi:putative resolvase